MQISPKKDATERSPLLKDVAQDGNAVQDETTREESPDAGDPELLKVSPFLAYSPSSIGPFQLGALQSIPKTPF